MRGGGGEVKEKEKEKESIYMQYFGCHIKPMSDKLAHFNYKMQ